MPKDKPTTKPSSPAEPADLPLYRAALQTIADPATIRGLAMDDAVARLQTLARVALS